MHADVFLVHAFGNVNIDTSFARCCTPRISKPVRTPQSDTATKSPLEPRDNREETIRPKENGIGSRTLSPSEQLKVSMLFGSMAGQPADIARILLINVADLL